MSTRVSPPYWLICASDRLRASDLHVAAANLNAAASLRRGGRRGCRLPSDTAPTIYAGLEQLGGGRLIGLEQLIRPRQTPKPCAQRLDQLIMRLDCLARPPAISSRSRFL